MAFFLIAAKVSFEARTLNFPYLFLSHELLWPAGPFVIISFQVQQLERCLGASSLDYQQLPDMPSSSSFSYRKIPVFTEFSKIQRFVVFHKTQIQNYSFLKMLRLTKPENRDVKNALSKNAFLCFL